MVRSLIIKVAADCNLHCQYCYVERSRGWRRAARIMQLETLERIIREAGAYCRQQRVARFVFYWHGGEPLLAGPAFFETAARLQQSLMPAETVCVNSLQTNGTLIDREWIRRLRRLGYAVCVSLDGPETIHDARRRDRAGRGTYRRVLRAIDLMRSEEYPVALMAVITPEALPHGRRIYQHFRELGCTWMDLMYPMCNALSSTLDQQIQPAEWGQFYIDVFDAWAEEDNPAVYIRQIHDWCMLLLGGKTEMCTSESDCSYVMTIGTDGAASVCDDVMPFCESALGNINVDNLSDLANHPRLLRMGDRQVLYGAECRDCYYFPACKGGCTLFRAKARGDFSGRHYFCDSQRAILGHIRTYLCSRMVHQTATNERLAEASTRSGEKPGDIAAA